VADCARTVGTPLTRAGHLLIQVGRTQAASGGAVAADLLGLPDSAPARPDLAAAPALFDALHRAIGAGTVTACHDLSEGGLAAAAAEMLLGSRGLGARLDAGRAPAEPGLALAGRLFCECPSRFLAEVSPQRLEEFGGFFRARSWAVIGEVTADGVLDLRDGARPIALLGAAALAAANGVPGDAGPNLREDRA
jgi:phosphoribosylformylglycinamidine synthase